MSRHVRKHNRRPASGVSTSVESLEKRLCMAGDVSVTLEDDTLRIVGDNLGNQVLVDQLSANLVRVTGLEGTTINGLTARIVPFAAGDLQVNLKGGDDLLTIDDTFGQALTVRKLAVETEAGKDTIDLANLRVLNVGETTLNLGVDSQNEGDDVILDEVRFDGSLKIRTGGGGDQVFINQAQITLDLSVESAGGNDDVSLRDTAVGRDASIEMGDGGDDVEMRDTVVVRDLKIDGGKGGDDVFVGDFGDFILVGRDVVVNGGDGDDDVIIAADTQFVTVLGNLTVNGGGGADDVGLGTAGEPIEVKGKLTVNGGSGDDTLDMKEVTAGDLLVEFRAGGSILTVDGLEVAVKAEFKGGSGLNNVTIDGVKSGELKLDYASGTTIADIANVTAAAFSVTTGSNSDTVTVRQSALASVFALLGGGDDILTVDGVASNKATIEAGGGKDTVNLARLFVLPKGELKGDLTVKGGNGDDRVNLDTVVAASAVFDGGAGTDTLVEENVLFTLRDVKNFEVVQ